MVVGAGAGECEEIRSGESVVDWVRKSVKGGEF